MRQRPNSEVLAHGVSDGGVTVLKGEMRGAERRLDAAALDTYVQAGRPA
jgi:hypothetical protein